jgi:hypothetical protein
MNASLERMLERAANAAVEAIATGDEVRADDALTVMFGLALLGREQESTGRAS